MNLKESFEKIKSNDFVVEIYGLGYVGFPLAVRLSKNGFKVIGIDVNTERIERLQNNQLMDSELLLKNEFLESRERGLLELDDKSNTDSNPKIGIICVPTPIPTETTSSDIFVKSAVESFLKYSKKGDAIILESSIEVGTTEKIEKIIESRGYSIGNDFGLCFCPERIDPQNKEWGIENIPRVIYCSDDISFEIAEKIYQNVNNGNLIRVEKPKIAEVVKSFENAFRLVNISLVNELAILCDKLGISVKQVIDAAATKPFGFLPHYPGAGAGGHCIPKDPRFLLESAKKMNQQFITIENALEINLKMPIYITDKIEQILEQKGLEKSVLVCGLSYKPNIEDMRDSSSFKLIKEMKNRGFEIFGYDPFFNIDYVEKYLEENKITELDFERLNDLDYERIKNISCMCIVQHHLVDKEKIMSIYEKSVLPCIYDCQTKLGKNKQSRTELYYLGE
ncbi:nucleotide sugar dehydrogenase [Nitrosopumilus sp.]|uniref:nucleotide sugar dehydrogenase n=1 Tax=Nitrosopumilus sp. TaxID=2024843 RepID=UPI00247D3ACF|nr:nucleotide sugar dehydrogenase [Nitrosopumilus sp.]MCV0430371.1 nucleotide sugar dehydrogenase [Nitrosopumilus sp.]